MTQLLPIIGFEGKYSVTSDGRVFSHRRNIFLRPGTTKRGYRYVYLGAGNERMVAHLVANAFLGPMPEGYYPDHINRDRTDNRAENIRYASHVDNQRNKAKMARRKGSSSKFKGVYRHSVNKDRPWIARIATGGISKHIGSFVSETDAALAYDAAALNLFGEFALTNQQLGLL